MRDHKAKPWLGAIWFFLIALSNLVRFAFFDRNFDALNIAVLAAACGYFSYKLIKQSSEGL